MATLIESEREGMSMSMSYTWTDRSNEGCSVKKKRSSGSLHLHCRCLMIFKRRFVTDISRLNSSKVQSSILRQILEDTPFYFYISIYIQKGLKK